MHKLLALACVFLAGVVLWAGWSQPAHAADAYAWTTAATQTYTSPSTKSKPVHSLKADTDVEPLCYIEGQEIDGDPSWMKILYEGETGFVHFGSATMRGALDYC